MCVITEDGVERLFVPGDQLPKFWQGKEVLGSNINIAIKAKRYAGHVLRWRHSRSFLHRILCGEIWAKMGYRSRLLSLLTNADRLLSLT